MAQINFFASKTDETELLAYIRSIGGYLARDIPARGVTEVVGGDHFEQVSHTSLHILHAEAFPIGNLNGKVWRTRVKRGFLKWTSDFAGPSICYQPHDDGYGQISCARLWCQYSALSFHGAGPWKGGPPLDFPERYADRVKAFERLYRNISSHIRKNFRREGNSPGSFWHGPDSDRLESAGVEKLQFIAQASNS